jgi:hypothetical protein
VLSIIHKNSVPWKFSSFWPVTVHTKHILFLVTLESDYVSDKSQEFHSYSLENRIQSNIIQIATYWNAIMTLLILKRNFIHSLSSVSTKKSSTLGSNKNSCFSCSVIRTNSIHPAFCIWCQVCHSLLSGVMLYYYSRCLFLNTDFLPTNSTFLHLYVNRIFKFVSWVTMQ